MSRETILERIHPDDTGRVLDRRRIRGFYLLMLPALLPFLVGGAGVFLAFDSGSDIEELVAGILIGVGVLLFLVYCVYESFLIGIYPARCYLQWLRERIDRRTDSIVKSDDPDAFFVQIIPRKNWSVAMGENAADVGLLVLDQKRHELRYEGDLERWAVPTECVRSFRLHSFTPPGGVPFLNKYTLVMLHVDLEDGDDWETPLACQPVHFEFWTPGKRRQRAELLADAIGHLVEPDRWPAIDEELLWPLRPPKRLQAVADFG